MRAAEIIRVSDRMVPSAAAWRYFQRACYKRHAAERTIPSLPGGGVIGVHSAFLSLVTLTFDVDIQTRPSDGSNTLPCEFRPNPFIGSRDIWFTNKQKVTDSAKTDSAKNRTLRSLLRAVITIAKNSFFSTRISGFGHPIYRVKWRHSNLWSHYEVFAVGQHGVLYEVKWWCYVAPFE